MSQRHSDRVVVHPAEYPDALRNPLMGFRPDLRGDLRSDWASVVRHYIRWNKVENDASDGVGTIREFCDQKWEGIAARNIKVIPRVYLEWPEEGKYWPADLQAGDYESDAFKGRLVGLIEKLSEAWDSDPRVAYIESGLIGYWGEQHSPEPTAELQKLMGDALAGCFREKLVMVRYPLHFQDYGFGVYWDSWGTEVDTPLMLELLLTGPYAERWRTAPMGGEVSYNYGRPPGANPDDTLVNHVQFAEDLVRRLHWNHLGWIADYDPENPQVREGAARLQKAFGYRFVIDEVHHPARVEGGGELQVTFTVRNTGSTPLYYRWPVEASLLDVRSRRPVWRGTFADADVRAWQPGTLWVWHQHQYAHPPRAHQVTGAFRLPRNLPTGEYVLALAILDPAGNLPSARFAIRNYFAGGRHPIGFIGVGTEARQSGLPEAEFDDLARDESLRYAVP